jgi:copper(I)-binding protein
MMSAFSISIQGRQLCNLLMLLFMSVSAIQTANAEMQTGKLMISDIEIRATASGMSATAGYVTITNHGMKADRLVGVKADFAKKSMIHEMTNIDGIAKMRHVMGGLKVPAHGSVALKPGGLHLMFTGVKDTLEAGKMLSVTLIFEKAGEQKLHAIVKKPTDIGSMSKDGKSKKKHAH